MDYSGVHHDNNHMMMRSLSDCGSSAATYGNGIGEEEERMLIKKGPWTEEEDSILVNYITLHGEGHWNTVAGCAGLKRTGKSCRLRWLNYLRPNVRRGNITLQEQLLILDLHSRYGNRWSKIAEHLPGRTDNEIKNYWRTRVVKQAKQLKCDVNSKQFRDMLRLVWMPRLLERIQASSAGTSSGRTSFSENTRTQMTNSSVLSRSKPTVGVEAASLSDSNVRYESMRGGGCSESVENNFGLWQQVESNMQTLEPCNGFELGADLWSDENIWFLQQQLADTDVPDGTSH